MKKYIQPTILTIIFYGNIFGQQAAAKIVSGLNSLFQGHVNQTVGLVPGQVIRIEKPEE